MIRGKAYVLGDNVDTDQIIPAHHLVYDLDHSEERKLYGKYALSGVPVKQAGLPNGHIRFIREGTYKSEYRIIIAGKNFGCGSSREHAPVALDMAGIQAVVANSYARIFYRNAVDGAYFYPYECRDALIKEIQTDHEIEIDEEKEELRDLTINKVFKLESLGEVVSIIEAGGIFQYARTQIKQ